MAKVVEAMADEQGGDEPSVDLRKLPRPPRRARALTLLLMALTSFAAGFLAWQLRSEALYALNGDAALELGALADTPLGPQHDNAYVRARVTLQPQPLVRFRRPVEGDEYQVARVVAAAGAEHRWVAYRVPESLAGPRFVPPSLVAGRLARVSDLGARYRGLEAALARASGAPEAASWLLVDGQDPRGASWLFGLLLLLLALVGWNLVAAVRILRKVAPGDADGGRLRAGVSDG